MGHMPLALLMNAFWSTMQVNDTGHHGPFVLAFTEMN